MYKILYMRTKSSRELQYLLVYNWLLGAFKFWVLRCPLRGRTERDAEKDHVFCVKASLNSKP